MTRPSDHEALMAALCKAESALDDVASIASRLWKQRYGSQSLDDLILEILKGEKQMSKRGIIKEMRDGGAPFMPSSVGPKLSALANAGKIRKAEKERRGPWGWEAEWELTPRR